MRAYLSIVFILKVRLEIYGTSLWEVINIGTFEFYLY